MITTKIKHARHGGCDGRKERLMEKIGAINILEYIDGLMEQGYNEEDANSCADYAFSDDWQHDDE